MGSGDGAETGDKIKTIQIPRRKNTKIELIVCMNLIRKHLLINVTFMGL